MSTSRPVRPNRDDALLANWESMPERAPSVEREDHPTLPRLLAMFGLFLFMLGSLAMLAPAWQKQANPIMSPDMGFYLATFGLCLILFHVFVERDAQFRRLYGLIGLTLLAVAVGLHLLGAVKSGFVITWPAPLTGPEAFFYFGAPALLIGFLILTAVIGRETDAHFRSLLLNITGGLGALMIAVGMINGLRQADYLPGEGGFLLIMGMLFVSMYVGAHGSDSDRSFYAGLALGATGLVGLVGSSVRSFAPVRDNPSSLIDYLIPSGLADYLIPSGLILMVMSVVYITFAAGVCLDWPVILVARRELASFFFSPVAYLVLMGQLCCGAFMFYDFISFLHTEPYEPILRAYSFNFIAIFIQSLLIPALTMRLLSEEIRAGTLEVLLTAPVNEISVVLGKFLAVWAFYMLLWLPCWLFLISLRYVGQQEFDYRPLLSVNIALAAISAGFLSMGLFFSGLTRNQVIAAVLTFVGMMVHLGCHVFKGQTDTPLNAFLTFVNYIDFWWAAAQGTMAPRYVVFHLSVTVFFLFATIKVLESRKWK